VAVEPLWQVEQLPLTEAWSNRTVLQLLVMWQSLQVLLVGIWLPGLPVAVLPLWQVAQGPFTAAWSKRTVDQFRVT
jgi:hypothetical protein